jgi:hypothetical protein
MAGTGFEVHGVSFILRCGSGCSMAIAARFSDTSLARNGGASPLCPAAGKVTL